MSFRLILAGTVALAALAGGACTNLASFEMGELPVPPDSPVAVAAREAARSPGEMPSFADIPRKSEDAPNPQVQAQSQAQLKGQVDALRAQANAKPLATTAQIEAEAARTRAPLAGVTAPSENAQAEMDAFVRAARARATPPPPPS